MNKFNERQIARDLNEHLFQRKALMVLPNTYWTGHETDLLCVMPDFRLIDIEIKVSRSDLKADLKKDKWWHHWDWKVDGPRNKENENRRRVRDWPAKVWKHYYAMPASIFKQELLVDLPPNSGVILLSETHPRISVKRRAKPNTKAKKVDETQAIDIARLATLRMWKAYAELDKRTTQVIKLRKVATPIKLINLP